MQMIITFEKYKYLSFKILKIAFLYVLLVLYRENNLHKN